MNRVKFEERLESLGLTDRRRDEVARLLGRWMVGAGLCLLFGCAGAPKELAPRTPPPRSIPPVAMPQTPPPAGRGRVVLFTTDGPMRVQARADLDFVPPGDQPPDTRMGDLCTTPCVADLPPGKYKLYLTSAEGDYSHGDVDVLDVKAGTNYYLRAPGKFESPRWIHVLPSLVVITGVTLALVGAGLTVSEDSGARAAGIGMMGGGVAITIAGGIYLYDESRGSTQEGATTSWWEPPSGH
jgi:hypothetical protein